MPSVYDYVENLSNLHALGKLDGTNALPNSAAVKTFDIYVHTC